MNPWFLFISYMFVRKKIGTWTHSRDRTYSKHNVHCVDSTFVTHMNQRKGTVSMCASMYKHLRTQWVQCKHVMECTQYTTDMWCMLTCAWLFTPFQGFYTSVEACANAHRSRGWTGHDTDDDHRHLWAPISGQAHTSVCTNDLHMYTHVISAHLQLVCCIHLQETSACVTYMMLSRDMLSWHVSDDLCQNMWWPAHIHVTHYLLPW